VSGLICARELHRQGRGVLVLDKGRGYGGRLSTRRASLEDGSQARFDHGTVAFGATDTQFKNELRAWTGAGVAALWEPRIAKWEGTGPAPCEPAGALYAGVPGMNGVCKYLGGALPQGSVRFSSLVERVEPKGDGVAVHVSGSSEPIMAEQCVVATPAPQSASILAPGFEALSRVAERVGFTPCWALMALVTGAEPGWDLLKLDGGPLGQVARDDSKPGRESVPGTAHFVAHATASWSAQHLEADREEARERLLRELLGVLGAGEAVYNSAHRWRFARVTEPEDEPCVISGPAVLCGDGFGGSGVEASVLSGLAASRALLGAQQDR